jgi:Fic family protein
MGSVLDWLKKEKGLSYRGGLYKVTQIDMAYNSNRIEGSTLSEEQTIGLFETQTIIGSPAKYGDGSYADLNDVIEMNNHFAMFNYMLDTADEELSEEIIKKFHYLLKRGTRDESEKGFNVGDYKRYDNRVGMLTTTPAGEVKEEMENLLLAYNFKDEHELADILRFHVQFETIHPFQDGNGRVGRMIMFRECIRNKAVDIPFIVKDASKQEYYDALRDYFIDDGRRFLAYANAQTLKYKELLRQFTDIIPKKEAVQKAKTR